jgi:toxin ParE1/3/4
LTRKILFTPAAEADIADAVDWYEERAPGLGDRLLGELSELVGRIEGNPLQFPLAHRQARRALMRRFPYAVFFRLTDAEVLVIACFHTSRDPKRWQERV